MSTTKDEVAYCGMVHVCCHPVTFWYEGPQPISTPLEIYLTDEAERRAKECITQGYNQGELNYENNDVNYRGWWKIER
jgi:hypothetical protein